FRLSHREDTAQDQRGDALRMRLGVGEAECRAPRSTEDEHLFGFQDLCPQPFDVFDQMPGGVVLQARMRRGAPAAALVEQQNLVALRVEQASMCAGASPAGTAMQEDRRLAIRVAAKLP